MSRNNEWSLENCNNVPFGKRGLSAGGSGVSKQVDEMDPLLELSKKEPSVQFEITKDGPAHKPIFTATFNVGSRSFTGFGLQKRTAQLRAAIAFLSPEAAPVTKSEAIRQDEEKQHQNAFNRKYPNLEYRFQNEERFIICSVNVYGITYKGYGRKIDSAKKSAIAQVMEHLRKKQTMNSLTPSTAIPASSDQIVRQDSEGRPPKVLKKKYLPEAAPVNKSLTKLKRELRDKYPAVRYNYKNHDASTVVCSEGTTFKGLGETRRSANKSAIIRALLTLEKERDNSSPSTSILLPANLPDKSSEETTPPQKKKRRLSPSLIPSSDSSSTNFEKPAQEANPVAPAEVVPSPAASVTSPIEFLPPKVAPQVTSGKSRLNAEHFMVSIPKPSDSTLITWNQPVKAPKCSEIALNIKVEPCDESEPHPHREEDVHLKKYYHLRLRNRNVRARPEPIVVGGVVEECIDCRTPLIDSGLSNASFDLVTGNVSIVCSNCGVQSTMLGVYKNPGLV